MEVAAGLVIAEELVSTTIQGGVGALALAKPTLPLKCSLSQFAKSPEDQSSGSLARAHHTLNNVNGDLYIFGGIVAPGKLASNEMHIIKLSDKDGLGSQYKCVPAIARDGESDDIPAARAGHTTCTIGEDIIMFGGYSDLKTKTPLKERGRVWMFSTSTLQWRHMDSDVAPPARAEHAATFHDGLMIVHGGRSADGEVLSDTYAFNPASGTWNKFPSALEPLSKILPPSFVSANGTLYLITHDAQGGNIVEALNLKSDDPVEWTALPLPMKFPNAGPKPRAGAGLVPLFTGQGRAYLLYMLGAKADINADIKIESKDSADDAADQWSGIWALQLPSSGGAVVKDIIRDKVGAETHEAEWAEVEIVPSEQVDESMEGKAHPGPRAYFACDVIEGTNKVMLWGGVDPSGSIKGDGWLIEVKTPSVRGVLEKIPGVGKLVKGEE